MAVTVLDSPRNVGMDIVDVILSMQGIKEKKKYRELQEAQLELSKKQLGISQSVEGRAAKTFAAEKPIRKEAAVTARGRTRLFKRFGRADKALETAKREWAVAKTTGDVARQAEAARRLSVVKKLHGDSAEMFESLLFADEIAKDSRAQLNLAQQGAIAANQTAEMLKMQLQQTNMRGQARLKGVADMVKSTGGTGGPALVNNIDRILDPSQSIADITSDLAGQIAVAKGEGAAAARQGKWIDPADFTKTEKEKFDPWSLAQYSDAFRNTGKGIETMTIARPKDQRRFWWRDQNEMTLTRKRALEIGVGDLYDAAKSKEGAKGQVKTQPQAAGITSALGMGTVPTRTKTVKELADEKAKKVRTTPSKPAQKPTGKKTVGGYTVGQVINRAGKRYKVTGFDTDGEPLVVEIK